jgi:hypothetical protein
VPLVARFEYGANCAEKEIEMSEESKTTPHGRNARTGEFTTVDQARKHPSTHVVERVPKPGYGDTKKK